MQKKYRSLLALVLAAVILFSSACTKEPAPVETTVQTAAESTTSYEQYQQTELKSQAEFDAFTEKIFRESISANTIDLHYTLADPSAYGITDYEVTLGSYDTAEQNESLEMLKNYQKELLAFPYEKLSEEQQLTYDIFNTYLTTAINGAKYYLYDNPVMPTIGIQSQLPVLLAEYTFYSEKDIQEYLVLLSQLDDYFTDLVKFENEKADAGLFMSDEIANEVIDGCRSFIENPEENFLIEVFDEKVDAFEGLSDEARASYKQTNRDTVLSDVINAYQILIDGLTALLGRGTNSGGLCNFPEGKEYYEYLIASNIGSPHSVEELLALTTNQLGVDSLAMNHLLTNDENLMAEVSSFTFSLSDPTEILEDLKSKIGKDFPALQDTNYTVKYVHKSMEESLSPAFYLTPPIDRLQDNVIYINNGSPQNENSLYSTLAHEGYPGHLYQTVYSSAASSCNLRRALSYTGFSEGWATYVEFYSYSLDSGQKPELASLMSHNASASLALYALMDMNINYNGWDLAKTGEFLNQFYEIEDQEVIQTVYNAMISQPANYLNYYVGYLEILQLRQKAEKALGDKFSLLDFHTFLLDIGDAPFTVLNDYLDQWIGEQ